MTLPQPLSILYNPHGSKNGAARSGASTPAPGLTGWTFATRGGLPVADAMVGHHGRYRCLMVRG